MSNNGLASTKNGKLVNNGNNRETFEINPNNENITKVLPRENTRNSPNKITNGNSANDTLHVNIGNCPQNISNKNTINEDSSGSNGNNQINNVNSSNELANSPDRRTFVNSGNDNRNDTNLGKSIGVLDEDGTALCTPDSANPNHGSSNIDNNSDDDSNNEFRWEEGNDVPSDKHAKHVNGEDNSEEPTDQRFPINSQNTKVIHPAFPNKQLSLTGTPVSTNYPVKSKLPPLRGLFIPGTKSLTNKLWEDIERNNLQYISQNGNNNEYFLCNTKPIAIRKSFRDGLLEVSMKNMENIASLGRGRKLLILRSELTHPNKAVVVGIAMVNTSAGVQKGERNDRYYVKVTFLCLSLPAFSGSVFTALSDGVEVSSHISSTFIQQYMLALRQRTIRPLLPKLYVSLFFFFFIIVHPVFKSGHHSHRKNVSAVYICPLYISVRCIYLSDVYICPLYISVRCIYLSAHVNVPRSCKCAPLM